MRLFLFIFQILACSLPAQKELKAVDEIKRLSPEEAAKPLLFDIEVQILKIYDDSRAAFVHDGVWGIYLAIPQPYRSTTLTQGDLIRVKGHTAPGLFLPHLVAKSVTLIRNKEELPDTLAMTKQLHFDPTIDCAWVQLRGIVVESAPAGKILSLRVRCYGDTITNIILTRTPEIEQACKQLVHQKISAKVIAVTKANSRRQMTNRFFQAHSLADIRVEPVQRVAPLSSISDLMQAESSSRETGRIRGTVTHVTGERTIFLEDESGGILIIAKDEHSWQRGSTIEAHGLLTIDPVAPTLAAQEILEIDDMPGPKPTPIEVNQRPLPIGWHHSLVEVDVKLIDVRTSDNATILSCASNGHVFEASLRGPPLPESRIRPNAELRLTGICRLHTTDPHSFYRIPGGISLILRDTQDLQLLQSPPWWNLQRILTILTIVIIFTGLTLFWIALLRRKVKEQTVIIGSQIEREVTIRERQRLARELHDSLEQNMGSLAFQLTSAQRHREMGTTDRLEKSLSLAQKTLAHCQRESRESIYDLRRETQLQDDQWHDEVLKNEITHHHASLSTSITGQTFQLDHRTHHHTVKIIREAAINALRHGGAKLIEIEYRYLKGLLEIQITDDGCGFDPANEIPKGHFGIIGMRERINRINGGLEISSKPGKGTTLVARIPKKSNTHDDDTDSG